MLIFLVIIVAILAVLLAYFFLGSSSKEKNTSTSFNKWGFDRRGFDASSRKRGYYLSSYKKLAQRCNNLKQLHDQGAYDDVASAARGICERALRECLEHWGYAIGDFAMMIATAQRANLLDQVAVSKLHSLRRHGNDALHGNADITQPQAYFCYKATQETVGKIYSRIISG